tara:strand:+ start:550 stop:933 length:384 start_codon:yes stop_codon:yes gene_type:complete
MAFDISVNESKMMHIFKNNGYVSCYSYSFFAAQLYCCFLHVKQIEETTLFDELENYVDVWNLGDDTHKHGNVRMSKDALHYDFVLDFLKKLICNSWVNNFLDGNWSTIKFTGMDDRETTLTNLFSKF